MDSSNVPPSGTTSPEFKHAVERGKRSSQVLTGVILVALGGIFLIDRMGDEWGLHMQFSRLWPLLLIVAGLGISFSHYDSEVTTAPDGTVRHDRTGRRFGDGLFLMLVGILMLAHVNHWMRLTQSWPLFIVAGGLSMIFGRGRRGRRLSRREYR